MLKRLFLMLALSLAPLEDAQAACAAPAPAPEGEATRPLDKGFDPRGKAVAGCEQEAALPVRASAVSVRARLLESRLNKI